VPELPWNSEMVDLFMIRSFLDSREWRRASEACRAWLRKRRKEKSGETLEPMIRALNAEALRNQNDFSSAHNHLQRALEKEPGRKEFWYADLLVSWEGKDYPALKKALRALESLGGDPDILKRFSILSKAGTSDDLPAVITMLQNSIRSLGPEPELMYALGEAYLKAGLLEESLSWFKKIISLKKDHESARLGEIAALEALLEEAPGGGRGGIRISGQKSPNEKAGEDLSAALSTAYRVYLEEWPDNSAIRREHALFLVKTFEYAEAASELEKLLIWEPSNSSLRRVLAYAYRKTGRYREAAVFLKSLLKEKPKDIGLLIEYSGCLERIGAGYYAIAVLEKARELFNESPLKSDISLALGILSYRQKGVEKAFDYLREAAAFAPNDPRPYEWMAIIARKNGYQSDGNAYEKEAEKRKKNQNKR
jgi:tetratricopeptide (TPR) repeat protein